MAADLIGLARCPVPSCGSAKARLTLARSGLPVLTCNACNFQGFARSDRSDTGLRSLLVERAPAAPPAEPAPIAAAAAEAIAPPAVQAPRSMGWGVLG